MNLDVALAAYARGISNMGLPALIWAYIQAIAEHWIVLLTGVAGLALALVERVRGRNISWVDFGSYVAAVLLLSGFLAWRDAYIRNLPTVRIEMKEIQSAQVVRKDNPAITTEKPIVVKLVASVINRGKPKSLSDWNLKIITADGRTVFDDGATSTNRPAYITEREGGTAQLESYDEQLFVKAANLIPEGASVTGYLYFRLPRTVDIQDLRLAGTSYDLTCKDSYGNDLSGV